MEIPLQRGTGGANNPLCVAVCRSGNAREKGIQMNCSHPGIQGGMLSPKHPVTIEPAVQMAVR